jgi:MFS family permease
VAGLLAERWGRKNVLLASLVIFVLAGGAALVTPDAVSLMVSRVLLGVAGGGMLTVCVSLAGDFPEGGPRERLLGFAVAGASTLAAVALVGGGATVDHFGWRAPFALYLLGVPVLAIAWRSLRTAAPVQRLSEIHLGAEVRPLWPIYLTVVLLTVGMFMPSIQGPFLLQAEGITSAATYGLIAAACSVVAALSSGSFGWLVRVVRPGSLLVLIALCFGLGSIGMALSHQLLQIGLASAVMGIAAGLVEATAATLILRRVHEHARGPAIGLLLSAIFLGQFLNPWVVDPLRHAFGIQGAFVAVGVVFLLLAGVLMLGHQRMAPAAESEAHA